MQDVRVNALSFRHAAQRYELDRRAPSAKRAKRGRSFRRVQANPTPIGAKIIDLFLLELAASDAALPPIGLHRAFIQRLLELMKCLEKRVERWIFMRLRCWSDWRACVVPSPGV